MDIQHIVQPGATTSPQLYAKSKSPIMSGGGNSQLTKKMSTLSHHNPVVIERVSQTSKYQNNRSSATFFNKSNGAHSQMRESKHFRGSSFVLDHNIKPFNQQSSHHGGLLIQSMNIRSPNEANSTPAVKLELFMNSSNSNFGNVAPSSQSNQAQRQQQYHPQHEMQIFQMNHNQSFARMENILENQEQHKVYLNMQDLQNENNQPIKITNEDPSDLDSRMPVSKVQTQPINSAVEVDNGNMSPHQLQSTPNSTLILPDSNNQHPNMSAPATHTEDLIRSGSSTSNVISRGSARKKLLKPSQQNIQLNEQSLDTIPAVKPQNQEPSQNKQIHVRIRTPDKKDEIIYTFKYLLREKEKLLTHNSYLAFGSVNASQLIKNFVPKTTTEYASLRMQKDNENITPRQVNFQHFRNSQIAQTRTHSKEGNRMMQLQKLSQEELQKVIKDSYKTLISLKTTRGGAAVNTDDEPNDKKENLKKKYAKFTSQLLLQQNGGGGLQTTPSQDQSQSIQQSIQDKLNRSFQDLNSGSAHVANCGGTLSDTFLKHKNSVHHHNHMRDERHQILDMLSSGYQMNQVQSPDEQIVCQQIMIKKIEKELESAPKRLRSIMAFSSNASNQYHQPNILIQAPPPTSSAELIMNTARQGLQSQPLVSNAARMINTSYTNTSQNIDQKFAKTTTNGFFSSRVENSSNGFKLINPQNLKDKLFRKGLGQFTTNVKSAAHPQRIKQLEVQRAMEAISTVRSNNTPGPAVASTDRGQSPPPMFLEEHQQTVTFDIVNQLNTDRQVLETFGNVPQTTLSTERAGMDKQVKKSSRKVPIEEKKNIIRLVHFDYLKACAPPQLLPKDTKSQHLTSSLAQITPQQIISEGQQEKVQMTDTAKDRKLKNYHGFRVPNYESSLISSTTNGISDVQTQAAVQRRIKVDDIRLSKQKIKIEDKLQIIQDNASIMNFEKRKQLMSVADKGYFGFIQETVDKISRIKILSPPPSNNAFKNGLLIQDSTKVPTHKKTIITDISLKKGDYLSGMRDLQAESITRETYSSNNDLNKSPLHHLLANNSPKRDLAFLKGISQNMTSSTGILGPTHRFLVRSKNQGNQMARTHY